MNQENVRTAEMLYASRIENGKMHRLPRRISLVQETARTLKEWISTGVFSAKLPGELRLKTRLGVGRDTLRSALKLLINEGWIASSGKGLQRRIEPGRITSQMTAWSRRLPVTFLSPHRIEHRVTLLEMADTESRLVEQGLNLRFISPDIFHLKNPDYQLEQLVETHPSSAWILFISSEAIQRWFNRRGIPTFLYEPPYPGVDLPYVASDWEGAAFHAGVQLLRQGHRTIGILEYQERRPGLLAMESGLRRALASVGAEGRLAVFKDDNSPASVARSLEAAFSRQKKPTALVLSRASQLLTCYSWLASKGIRVPADISIVSLANDSWFKDLHPAICHYQPSSALMSRNIADRVLELATTGQITRKSLRIELEYIPGATIGSNNPESQRGTNLASGSRD